MYRALVDYIEQINPEIEDISEERKKKLQAIAEYIREKREEGETARLSFICTHNSRRSHLSQFWATVAAHYVGIEDLAAYSGGTEASAFNPRAVAAIRRAGAQIEHPGGENPRYRVFFDDSREPVICFSKRFDDPANPAENFAAVMTCSEADENCPFIPGASARVAIPYTDPKEADGTPEEASVYDERCRQIATEMLYMLLQV